MMDWTEIIKLSIICITISQVVYRIAVTVVRVGEIENENRKENNDG